MNYVNNYNFQNELRCQLNQIKHQLKLTNFALAKQFTELLIHQLCHQELTNLSNLKLQNQKVNLENIKNKYQNAKSEMQYLTQLSQLRYLIQPLVKVQLRLNLSNI